MALKLRAWLLAALVLFAAVAAAGAREDPVDGSLDKADPDNNPENNAGAEPEASEGEEKPPPVEEGDKVEVVDPAATGDLDEEDKDAAADGSGEESEPAPAPQEEESGGEESSTEESDAASDAEDSEAAAGEESSEAAEPVANNDADTEAVGGSGPAEDSSGDGEMSGPGTDPVVEAAPGQEDGEEGSKDEDEEGEESGGESDVDAEADVDPDTENNEGGDAEQTVASLTRDGTPPPHPTPTYDNRTEYQGFEYAGPVVHARHAVLDSKAKCALYGNPSTTFTFDNRGYAFRGAGAFVMYRLGEGDSREEVQALQTRTPLPQAVPRTVGVAIRAPSGQVLEVRYARAPGSPASEASLRPYVTLNAVDITKRVTEEGPSTDTEAFEITRDGVFGAASGKPMIMAARCAETGTTVAVTFERTVGVNHLNVYVEVAGTSLGRTSGLCGNYDFNPGNDVLTVGSGAGVPMASGARTAAAHAVAAPGDALFRGYAAPSEVAVVTEPLQPVHMHATENDTAAAGEACAKLRKDFRKACVMSALVAGAEGVAEVRNAQDILLENSVVATPNVTSCLQDFFVGPWTLYGQCDAPCGAGATNRTRVVYSGVTREQCGELTQYRKCTSRCEHADVPGKCAIFGDPHVVTFDNRMYDFRGTGEYVMYHTLDDKEQVNVLFDRTVTNKTSQVSWATGVAFRSGPDVFSMHLPDAGDDFCSFRYNGRALGGLSRANVSYYGLFTVRRTGQLAGPDRSNLLVEVQAPGGTTVTAAFYSFGGVSSLMNLFLEVGGQRLKSTQGLCGSFDLDSKNDLTDVDGHPAKPRDFGWGWGVARNRTLFADATPVLGLPASRLPVAPRLIGANGTYEKAVNACLAVPPQLREACVIDVVTLGEGALQMIKDVDAAVEEDRIDVEYVAKGCLVEEGSYLGPWTDWSECTRECNGGEATRSRGIFAYNSERCGTESEKRECNMQPCPIDCEVGPWRNWAECSVTCGNGTETRTRGVVVPAQHGGEHCAPLHEDRECERLPCCEVGEWDDFSECRPDGTKIRKREVNFPARCGKTTDVAECCYADPWPVSSNEVNGTGAKGVGGEPLWSACEDGEQVRRRRVFPEHCAADIERRPCCDAGRWSHWGECTDGAQTRWRTVTPSNCSHSSETRVCCTQYAWGGWSECVGGKRNRTRSVAPTGCDTSVETEDCCHFGNWTVDNATQCVKGEQLWRRRVDPPTCGKATEKRECCSWEDWEEWSDCTKGSQSRERTVYGPEGCAPANETRECNNENDPEFKAAVDKAVAAALAAKANGTATGGACGCNTCPCAPKPAACGCSVCPCAASQQQQQAAPVTDGGAVRPRVVAAGTIARRLQQQLQL